MHYDVFINKTDFVSPNSNADQIAEHCQGLISMGLLEYKQPTPENATSYKVTEKGVAYLESLLSVPLPESRTVWKTTYPPAKVFRQES